MLSAIKNLFSSEPKVDFGELITNKAVILDVRTKEEYQGGHIKGSINIPLQSLNAQLSKLKKDKVIITCCASGGRSSVAKKILKSNGFENVHNAGSWTNLR
jgi:rhodanese-related sulfurtransferase